MNEYTNEQLVVLVDLFFRDSPRPAPWPAIAKAMGVEGTTETALERLLWGIVTGYSGNDADCARRRVITRHPDDTFGRAFAPWHAREDKYLRKALGGEGQNRLPPVDMEYVATVLARKPAEVAKRWAHIQDPLGRGNGFGLGRAK